MGLTTRILTPTVYTRNRKKSFTHTNNFRRYRMLHSRVPWRHRHAGSRVSGCTLVRWGDTHTPKGQREESETTSQSHGNSSWTRLQSLGTKSSSGAASSSKT